MDNIRDKDFHLLKLPGIILESCSKIGTALLVIGSGDFAIIYEVWMDTQRGIMSLYKKK
jgi:hypothetical protein